MANRFQSRLESSENLVLGQVGELLAKTLEIAEGVLVDDAGKAEEFEQRVLQRRSRQKKLVPFLQCQLERVRYDVGWFVNVAQAVGFVDDHEIPRGCRHVRRFAPREMVGANDDSVLYLERPEIPLFDRLVVRLGLQYPAGEEEFFRQFLIPLLAQIGRHDN